MDGHHADGNTRSSSSFPVNRAKGPPVCSDEPPRDPPGYWGEIQRQSMRKGAVRRATTIVRDAASSHHPFSVSRRPCRGASPRAAICLPNKVGEAPGCSASEVTAPHGDLHTHTHTHVPHPPTLQSASPACQGHHHYLIVRSGPSP